MFVIRQEISPAAEDGMAYGQGQGQKESSGQRKRKHTQGKGINLDTDKTQCRRMGSRTPPDIYYPKKRDWLPTTKQLFKNESRVAENGNRLRYPEKAKYPKYQHRSHHVAESCKVTSVVYFEHVKVLGLS